jgi:hypothetical protein
MLEFEGDLALHLELHPTDRVDLVVVDASLARALFDGIPVARLLGRARLAYDERDGSDPSSSWDALMGRLLGQSAETKERVKRSVARHTRVAVDEGALRASDSVVATLVYAVAASGDADASLSEIFPARRVAATTPDGAVVRACASFDPRLASPSADLRAPMFEACVRLATRAQLGPIAWQRLKDSADKLRGPELALTLLRTAQGSLFPRPVDEDEIAPTERRMARLDRAEVDALVAKDPHELATAIVRIDNASAPSSGRARDSARLDTLIADLARLLSYEGALVLAISPSETSLDDDELPEGRESRPSWQPYDWASAEAATGLAEALEKGATTAPRVRAVVLGGGDPALDAIGAEMLHAALHPFASAAFAEILAHSARPRDVMRLVTYFAVAPDPSVAARALSVCTAPELPRVLSAWLEAMLPSDGELAPSGDDPDTSSAARLTACVAALAPYPHLHRAVRPLLQRVSDAPPASA